MFEQSVLDNMRQGRSKWSWMGLVVQAGLVTAMLLVPMVSPEVLSVMLPKSLIYVPVKSVAPIEVEVQPAPGSRANSQNTVVIARPVARAFTAPRSYNNPVNNIIDSGDFAPPPLPSARQRYRLIAVRSLAQALSLCHPRRHRPLPPRSQPSPSGSAAASRRLTSCSASTRSTRPSPGKREYPARFGWKASSPKTAPSSN